MGSLAGRGIALVPGVTAHKGLMAMRRADIWPAGDLALAVAVKELWGLEFKPTPDELERIAERWRPYRAVAARMLWQHYLFGDR